MAVQHLWTFCFVLYTILRALSNEIPTRTVVKMNEDKYDAFLYRCHRKYVPPKNLSPPGQISWEICPPRAKFPRKFVPPFGNLSPLQTCNVRLFKNENILYFL